MGVTVNGKNGSLPGLTVIVRLKVPAGVEGSEGDGDSTLIGWSLPAMTLALRELGIVILRVR